MHIIATDLPQPDLPPVQQIAAIASSECEARAVAENLFQHDCILEVLHLSGAFGDEIVSPISHSELPAAKGPLVGTEV